MKIVTSLLVLLSLICYAKSQDCPTGEFKCASGQCIPMTWVCDDVTDCQGEQHPGSDEQDCPPVPCTDQEFKCDDSSCIPIGFKCDGSADCSNGEDEQLCPGRSCSTVQFTCTNGYCISPDLLCDHFNDCPDGSDENSDCDYPNCEEITCDNGECVRTEQICDGTVDCRDQSDEFNCSSIRCPTGQFQCSNGDCIPLSFYCDSWDNCGDGSDEPDTCDYPSCAGNALTCDNSRCVPQDLVCDGNDDCGDGTDEKHCNYDIPCLNNQWKCTNSSECIDVVQLCDNSNDCENGEDETLGGAVCSSERCGILSCDYLCQPTPFGGICYCPDGMQVANDGISCEDFNECEIFGQCEQVCENSVGGFKCLCDEDNYVTETDGNTVHCKAKPAAGAPKILFTSGQDIYFSDPFGGGNTLTRVVAGNRPAGVDYHFQMGKIFWADPEDAKIYSADLDGTNQQTILDVAIQDPEHVAVDWIANNLYVVETLVGRIEASNFDGSHRTTLVSEGLENPRGIAIDPTIGYMFFTDWHQDNPRLVRAFMDGTEVYTLVNTQMGTPSGVSVDYEAKRVYWVDTKFDYIETVDYNGRFRRQVLSRSSNIPHLNDITIFETNVFVTDQTKLAVLQANKFDGSDLSSIYENNQDAPNSVVVYHPSRQPKVSNPCEVQNGGCAHLCVLSHTLDNNGLGYSCKCDPGFTISYDGKSCSEITNAYMLISAYDSVRGISTNPSINDDIILPILGNYEQAFLGVTGDAVKGYIYFLEAYNNVIQRRFTNGSGSLEDVIISNLGVVRYIALDWTTDNLYIVDNSYKTISAINVNDRDKLKKDLVSNLYNPTGLALSPLYGYMVYADMLRPAHIYKTWMDGTHMEVLVNTSIYQPIAITIDLSSSYVYWVDLGFNRLEKISLYGYSRQQFSLTQQLPYPFSIGVASNFVFWSDIREQNIYRVYKYPSSTPATPDVVEAGVGTIYSMSMQDKSLQTRYYSNQCNRAANPNGGCQFFCFPAPSNSRSCGCPNGFYPNHIGTGCLRDPHSTVSPPCDDSYQFSCANGRCIYHAYTCNGIDDCRDGSDEVDCGTCGPYGYQCTNGKCISINWKCDGDDDCGDNSDESTCPSPYPCHSTQFSCDNGRCISPSRVCDSNNDCGDGSDEVDCEDRTCGPDQFTCPDHRCISSSLKCNGYQDCYDGADENDCPPIDCNPYAYFACSDGLQCISLYYLCDGWQDCRDGSDELDCPTRPPGQCEDDEFQCQTSGLCIPLSWRCDARRDCDDGSDEPPTCPPVTCPSNYFKCDNNYCVYSAFICDGDNDCGDLSDERDCPTPPPTLPPPPCKYNEWECPGTTVCINFDQVCDGFNDCVEGTDEGAFCAAQQCNNFGCTDKCAELPTGPLCWCDGDGYELLNDTKTCADIDECALYYCSQECDNLEGSFFCKCDDGYVLGVDGRTCQVAEGSRILWISNRNYLYKMNLDTNSLTVPISSSNILGTDFDWITRRLYYADTGYGRLYKIFENGSGRTSVFDSGQSITENVAVDWVARNLYWCDSNLGTIEVARIDGTHRAILHSENVTSPRGLVLDPRDQYHFVFWTDWGQYPRIERADMDGKNRQAIISDQLYWPNGLTIDYPTKLLYFADAKLDFIHRCNYKGGDRTVVLASALILRHPHSLTVLEDTLYWTDRETSTVSKCNKWNGNNDYAIVISGLSQPTDIHSYNPARQPNGTNYCNNSPCSHICLLSTTSPFFSCACPVGASLTDSHTCTPGHKPFLMVSTPGLIYGIGFEPSDQNNDKMVPITNINNGMDVEHDDRDGWVYWVDEAIGQINRIHVNGTSRQYFAPSSIVGKPHNIAIDWMSRNLYYTNPVGKSIEVIRLDPGDYNQIYRKTILGNIGNETGVGNPVGIVVDPLNGKMYWSDRGADVVPAKISRCNLDGTQLENIITQDMSGVQHIAIDIPNRIYWADQKNGAIRSATLDGNDIRTIVDNVVTPMALVVYAGYIYYSDLSLELIERADMNNGNNQEVLRSKISDVTSLNIFDRPVGRPNSCYINNGQCEQFCFPQNTFKSCGCSTGSKINADGLTCSPHDSFIVVSQKTIVRGFDLSDENSHEDAMLPIASPNMNNTALDIDYSVGYVAFNTFIPGTGTISRLYSGVFGQKYDGRGQDAYVLGGIGQGGIGGFALDWIAKNVYFTNVFTTETYIEVSKYDRTYRVVLMKTESQRPRSMAVNPIKKYLYWADDGQTPQIVRTLLDGTNMTAVSPPNMRQPQGLTIDYSNHEVYWTDSQASTIEKIAWDLTKRVILKSGRNYPSPLGVALYMDKIYWVDSSFKAVFRGSKDPANQDDPVKIRGGLEDLKDITIYDSTIQPTGDSPCSSNNGGCEQLCFAMPDNSKVCDCAYGVIGTDGQSCTDASDYIMFTTYSTIESAHIDPTDHSQIFEPISANVPIAITYDVEDNRAYFATYEGSNSKIGYFDLSSPNPTPRYIITTGLSAPEGIDFDWLHKRVLYTDASLRIIGSVYIDGTNSTTLLSGLERPRAIAVDACRGFVYWTDWGTVAKILRATLAGNDKTTIIGEDLYWPNGLSIDFAEDTMYWVDAQPGYERMEVSNLDGTNRRSINPIYDHPFAISVLGDYIYWTDWGTNGVYRANKFDGGSTMVLRKDLPIRVYGVVGYSSTSQTECRGYDPCTRYNGGCSHICTKGPNYIPECSCPKDEGNKYYLANNGKECIVDTGQERCASDKYTCPNGNCIYDTWVCDGYTDCANGVEESARVCADNTCASNKHRCPSGKCIPVSYICDFDDDCGDGSDESGCPVPTCDPDEFTCLYGRCISQSWVCNGYDNCRDGIVSDEKDCPDSTCRDNYVKCENTNVCIYETWLCDGDDDCGDNSDEAPVFCANKTCSDTQFQCDNGQCIPIYWYCDNYNDCADGSDESICDDPTSTCPSGGFKCDNGRCIISDWVCDGYNDCSDGSDEGESQNCQDRTCDSDEFTCPTGSVRCIDSYRVCNGWADCADAADELQDDCTQRSCSSYEFLCDNGLCISSYYVCDHDNDCGDYSDEYGTCTYQPCYDWEFTCENGICIYGSYKCDGRNDCGDNSDEDNCEVIEPSCGPEEFMCESTQCIDLSVVCNRNPDCLDGSDEFRCGVNECEQISSNQCAQLCVDTLTSYYCDCNKGYRLMEDGKACEDINECVETPYVCSQLCDNTDGGYYCKCGNGYLREPDGITCKQSSGIDPYLIFTNGYYIRKISTTGSNYDVVLDGLEDAGAMDYHYRQQRLYYSDDARDVIESVKFDGTDKKLIIQRSLPNVINIAVDWIADKIYYSDYTLNAIYVSELNGSSLATLLKGCLYENNTYCFSGANEIVVHPKRGYIFWAHPGNNPYIGRAGLNGGNPTTIVTRGVAYPRAMAIDQVTERIYWADTHYRAIEFCDVNGNGRYKVDLDDISLYPVTMAFFESYMYWADFGSQAMYKAHALDGTGFRELVNSSHPITDVKLIHPYKQDQTLFNPCAINNGGCSHLCVLVEGGQHRDCLCPDGFIGIHHGLTNIFCVPACTSAQYRCDTTEKCIPIYWQCDGVEDCPDGSDEPDTCPPRFCDPGYFQCLNHECILPEYMCDFEEDCSDGSDERICDDYACLENQFKCTNTKCLNNAKLCDGIDDCGDNSDEDTDYCNARTCSGQDFKCDNGKCISAMYWCDFEDDCGDGSDEDVTVCAGEEHRCLEHEISCATNYRCIRSELVCNGENDCIDNSDEQNCQARTCNALSEFRCGNGVCVPLHSRCDGNRDCDDGSDESGCAPRDCTESEFQCANLNCIRGSWVCDQNDDCGDNSDEIGCPALTCQPGYFECSSGHCISSSLQCDGARDCNDASDELYCTPKFPDDKFCPPDVVFECDNHVCVNNNFRCDGIDDCGDRTDELPSVCDEIECDEPKFRCERTKICIFGSRVCDGVDDCGDGSDEDISRCHAPTEPPSCVSGEYKCFNKNCIPETKICDDVDDCGDYSDELGCHKGETNLTCSQSPCEQICTEIPGSENISGFYLCSCDDGYIVNDKNTHTCLDINECLNWKTCSQNCLNLKGNYYCDCVEGYNVVDSSCLSSEFAANFVADEQKIRVYDANNDREYDVIMNQLRVQSSDYFYDEKNTSFLFWSDTASYTDSAGIQITRPRIFRSILPYMDPNSNNQGIPQDLAIKGLTTPNGIAVDWVSYNLYWTDSEIGTISVALLDGRYKNTILSKLDVPYAIALDPGHGLMFWSTVGNQPGIFKSHMDGKEMVRLDVDVDYPTGIAIDYFNDDRLYISDERGDVIISVDEDGIGSEFIGRTGNGNPTSVDIFESSVYWTSKLDGVLYKMDKFGRGVKQTILQGLRNPTNVKVFSKYKYDQSVGSRCKTGICSHLCLLKPGSYVCACPDGTSLQQGSVRQCDASYLPPLPVLAVCQCRNAATCIYDKDLKPSCVCFDGYSGEFCENYDGEQIPTDSGVVIGVVVAVVVVLVLIVLGGLYYRSRRTGSFSDSKPCNCAFPSIPSCCNTQKESQVASFDNPVMYNKGDNDITNDEPQEVFSVETEGMGVTNPGYASVRKKGPPTDSGLSSMRSGYSNPSYKNTKDDSNLVDNEFSESSQA